MSSKRKDDVNSLYKRSGIINNISNIIFIFNIFFSFIIIFDFKYRNLFIMLSIAMTILYVFLININELIFNNAAETERRKSLLKESFDIPITLKETNKYYNNDESPSVERLGLNCYESSFFTEKVVDKMILNDSIKIIAMLFVYILLMVRLENLEILLVITQTIFSSEFIFYYIKLLFFKNKLVSVNEEFKNIYFINTERKENRKVLILDATMEYECLKSFYKISTSSKIFFKNNEEWTKQWKNMLKKMKKAGKKNG